MQEFFSRTSNDLQRSSASHGDKKENNSFFKTFIQPKLSINQPNDVYEQEADAMADHVMLASNTSSYNHSFFKPSVSSVQRKCAHCKEEEKAQRKENNNNTTEASPETENYVNT